MQPIIYDQNGIQRFLANSVVCHLLDAASKGLRCDMNDLARQSFSKEDRQQFAQLIGYSLSGYGELSYVTDEAYGAAAEKAENPELSETDAELQTCKKILYDVRMGMRGALGILYGKHPDDFLEED